MLLWEWSEETFELAQFCISIISIEQAKGGACYCGTFRVVPPICGWLARLCLAALSQTELLV